MTLVGKRVRWTNQTPGIACFAPPCDQRPGTVVKVTSETPGKLQGGFVVGPSGLVVSVKYDDDIYPPLDWPAEALVTLDDGKPLLAQATCPPLTHCTDPKIIAQVRGSNVFENKLTIAAVLAMLGVGLWLWKR